MEYLSFKGDPERPNKRSAGRDDCYNFGLRDAHVHAHVHGTAEALRLVERP